MKESLCRTVYGITHEYIQDINYCISLSLSIPFEKLPSSNAQLTEMIEKRQLPNSLSKSLIEAVKDKEYLENMKRMETDQEFSKSQRMVTIPVSGLVMSKFCRLENEHKSVLDLWEPSLITRNVNESQTPLENAVLKNECKQIDSALKGGMNYINEQDSNGWTALHLSCSFIMNIPRLEATECLLNYTEMDPFVVNNYGNTALHYYSHIPVKESYRTRYRDILLKFLKDPEILCVQNHKVLIHSLELFLFLCFVVFIFLYLREKLHCTELRFRPILWLLDFC